MLKTRETFKGMILKLIFKFEWSNENSYGLKGKEVRIGQTYFEHEKT